MGWTADVDDPARLRAWKVGTFLVSAVIPSFVVLAWVGGVAELIFTLCSLMPCAGLGMRWLCLHEDCDLRSCSCPRLRSLLVRLQSQPTSTMITSTIGRQWRLLQSQPDAVTVTAAAVDVTLSAVVEGFTPCSRFEGARPGKVFKSGPAGVGYYDEPGTSKAEATGGDTVEAESSANMAKRQAAIRAMLG